MKLKQSRLPKALHELGIHGPCEADVLAELAGRPLEVVYRQLVHANDHGAADMRQGEYDDAQGTKVIAWVPSARLAWQARQEASHGQ